MKTNEQNFLDRLRQKPDSYRRNFSILVSAAITLVIIGVWATSLVGSLNTNGSPEKLAASTSFFSLTFIKDQIVSLFERPSSATSTEVGQTAEETSSEIKAKVQ